MLNQFICEELRESLALRNQYDRMRHGPATSNEKGGVLCGDASIATTQHGLTAAGRPKVLDTASAWLASGEPLPTLIISTDYRRGVETSALMKNALGIDRPVILDPRLRERNWGAFEGQAEDNCFAIYAQDRLDPSVSSYGSESVRSIVERLCSLIVETERTYSNEKILLVTHCDIAQILEGIFTGQPIEHYIESPMMATAERKPLKFTSRSSKGSTSLLHEAGGLLLAPLGFSPG